MPFPDKMCPRCLRLPRNKGPRSALSPLVMSQGPWLLKASIGPDGSMNQREFQLGNRQEGQGTKFKVSFVCGAVRSDFLLDMPVYLQEMRVEK
jgi:hypothetical protein